MQYVFLVELGKQQDVYYLIRGDNRALKGQVKGEYVSCHWCGKLIYKTQSQLKKYKNHYCSNRCQSDEKHAATYADRPCEICGKLMHVSKKSKQRFCSMECQNIWQTQ